jgi:single-stranded-DNA-specific exonuclease
VPTVRKLWRLRPHDDPAIRQLAAAAGVPPVVAQLLLHRGVTDPAAARRFLDCGLPGLHPPALLPGVPDAADRIARAIAAGTKIRVFGDYDTDGVTGTAILVKLVRQLGGAVDYHIPHRLEDGYGLNIDAVREAARDGVGLVVTVDCGITALEEAEEARRLGVQLVVTDHHEMLDELPAADAVVHPRLPGGGYPFDGLSGAGVAFKLAWAVAQRASGSERVTPELREFLLDTVGLAALGLVADVVPLRDENRILVRHGLARLAAKPSMGIRSLMDAAKLTNGSLKAEDVAYKLAPRLNAAGRLGCALLVVELLTTHSPAKARELADTLEGYNATRQKVERKIAADAREQIERDGHADRPAIVLGSADWHPGVVGIVAGRLADQYARPVVLVALKPNDEPSTGSGRSVPGVPLHEALRACGGELVRHGGHAAAAGVTVRPSKLDCFREAFVAHVAKRFPDGLPPGELLLDAEVPLSALTFGLLRDVDRLEPYGADNPRPRFLASGLTIEGVPRRIGTGERHLSFRVRQHDTLVRAVAFGMGERLDELMSAGGKCALAFTPKVNEWNGYKSVEMEVIDFRAGEAELG